ncbi:MAG: chalcone isomerase family protein [Betaproteobacteria bacterium]
MAFRIALLLMLAFPACAAEVAGVRLADKASVAQTELVLNGAGLRKRFIFDVYAMGLYLRAKSTSDAGVLNQAGPKRIALHMLRDVPADQFSDALADGIRENHSEAEAKALLPRLADLVAIMAQVREAKKGMLITLDWTGAGTQVSIDGKATGKPISGEEFYRALLRIWLGQRPVQEDLKKALLGG